MKLVKYLHQTVTQGDWNVGGTTGHGINGYLLDVFRATVAGKRLPVDKWMHPLGAGLLFPDSESAHQWAFDHGYLQLYFTSADLRARRKERAKDQRWLVVSGRAPFASYETCHGHCDTHATAQAMAESLASHGIKARVQRTY